MVSLNLQSQNFDSNIRFEYAHTFFKYADYNRASKLYNENCHDYYFLRYDIIFPIVSNYKIGNDSMFEFWISKCLEMNYTKTINYNKVKSHLDENELTYIQTKINEAHLNISISKFLKLNFPLYNKIKELSAIDQFIRTNSKIDVATARAIDSIFLFNELMDILHTKFNYSAVQDAEVDLYLLLIHQTDYIDNFTKLLELNYPYQLLNNSIITPFQYAYIMDMYLDRSGDKMKFGTLYSIGMKTEMDDENIELINKNRINIGLCEIEFDYRNVKTLSSGGKELLDKLTHSIK